MTLCERLRCHDEFIAARQFASPVHSDREPACWLSDEPPLHVDSNQRTFPTRHTARYSDRVVLVAGDMTKPLPWLEPGQCVPDAASAWGPDDPAPGLLAAGGSLDVQTLRDAYGKAVFPWFSDGQPILWWSPDPRMALEPASFRLHRSFRKTLQAFRTDTRCEVRIDHDFEAVIRACATTARPGQPGTWIVPSMIEAYVALHQAGFAHSIETWIDGKMVGGLYCVALGRAVFGESMFAHRPDASKTALAALVCLCLHEHVELIDCQQYTAHLSSLGAREISRPQLLTHVAGARNQTALDWHFDPVYWSGLLQRPPASST